MIRLSAFFLVPETAADKAARGRLDRGRRWEAEQQIAVRCSPLATASTAICETSTVDVALLQEKQLPTANGEPRAGPASWLDQSASHGDGDRLRTPHCV